MLANLRRSSMTESHLSLPKIIQKKGKYHLYISLACPWAQRTMIVRAMKGLEDVISMSSVHPVFTPFGWGFSVDKPDPIYKKMYLKELYELAIPNYEGRYTVPVLWDIENPTIVSKESEEIVRILNSEFNLLAKNPTLDLYPIELQNTINDLNTWIFSDINAGVYKAGFASCQEDYEKAVLNLFNALEKADIILGKIRYLCGNVFTEADVRLFTTLLRFDFVYYIHFKCSKKRLVDYDNLLDYVREIYQMPTVADTFNLEEIKMHYYLSHKDINPKGLIPAGPSIDFSLPHNRSRFSQ